MLLFLRLLDPRLWHPTAYRNTSDTTLTTIRYMGCAIFGCCYLWDYYAYESIGLHEVMTVRGKVDSIWDDSYVCRNG